MKFNNKLREETRVLWIANYIQIQRIKLYGHAMRREYTKRIKPTINWNPIGKKSRGRPKKC